MKMKIKLYNLKEELTLHLRKKILPFWMSRMTDNEEGGFYGRADNNGKIIKNAGKGAVMNTRILWTFSAAYSMFRDKKYLNMAERSYNYIVDHFIDKENGGIYWMLDHKGNPIEPKKQIYAEAFAIYSLSEYFKATGNKKALELAGDIYNLIEKHSFDPELNGYFEAYSRNWKILDDLRLSDKDINEKKTTNTHLHILEAYSNLLSSEHNDEVLERLVNLIDLFISRLINPVNNHLIMFFDEFWNPRSVKFSYGHDIETSWLLTEAAETTRSEILIEACRLHSNKMAETILKNGTASDGSIYNEVREDNMLDDDRHWWPQAEGMVGFMNAYQHTGDEIYVEAVFKLWDFIKKYLVHPELGEWYFRVNNKYEPAPDEEFAGPWKGPYHNGRMCMELIRRIEDLHNAKE
jgi:mannobiose 2-epimerase